VAINFGKLQLQLNPLAPIDLGGGAGGLDRERLKLMREQFENEKKQQAEQNRLKALAERGEMERARMLGERERAKAEAKAAAKLQEQKLTAYQKFTELNGSDLAGARSMVPLMTSLGMGVEDQGEAGGFPRYRISMDAAKDSADESARLAKTTSFGPGETAEQSLSRLDGMGLTGETGTLDDPQSPERDDPALALNPGATDQDASVAEALTPGDADIATATEFAGADGEADMSVGGRGMMPANLPGSDAYAQALAAGQYARDNGGKARRAPTEEDYTGAVPNDVIDTGANHALTLATLKPGLQSLVAAYPDKASRESAAKTAEGIEQLPLAGTKALEEYKSQRGGPDSLMVANAQADRFRETRDALTPIQKQQLRNGAYKVAERGYKNGGVHEAVTTIQAASTVETLMKGNKRNHEKAVNFLMKMTQNVGPQTETDALRTIGHGKLDTMDQLYEWLHGKVVTGFSKEDIDAINEFVGNERARAKGVLGSFLDNAQGQIRNESLDPNERDGWKQFLDGGSIPNSMLNEYDDERAARKKEEGGDAPKASGVTPGTGPGDEQLRAAGLDPEKLGRVTGHESGGDPTATSSEGASGTMQIMPKNLRAMGIEPEAFKKLSAEEQMAYNIRYLKNAGINKDSSADDYAMAVAAPAFVGKGDDSTVVYKKGTPEWDANKPWRPADGGDITRGSILAFYGLRGKGEKPAEAPAKAAAAPAEKKGAADLPEPQTPEEKRFLELLRKAGN
jgi:hypothetical protein